MPSINYTPPPTLRAFMRSEHRRRFVRGAVGSGKTTAMLMEILRRAVQQVPCTDGVRRSRWLVTRLTMPQLRDTVLKSWLQWFPDGQFGSWRVSDNTYMLRIKDVECEVLFRPLESPSDVSRVLSLEITGAWIAECRDIPLELVEAIDGRLGRYPSLSMLGGKECWVGMIGETNAPVEGSDWWKVFEHLPLEDGNPNSIFDCDTFVQPCPVDENYDLLPDAENAENLRQNYYPDLCRGKTDEFIRVFVKNEYGRSRSGRPVYDRTFRKDKHVSRKRLAVDPDLPVIIGMDFGLTPAAILAQAPFAEPRLNVLYEVVSTNSNLKDFVVSRLRPLLRAQFPSNDVVIIGDPSGNNREGTDSNTCFRLLRDFGFNARPARSNDPVVRIAAVEEVLSSYPMGDALLQIDPAKCPTLIDGFTGGYMFKQNAERPDKNRFSHIHDAFQYLCLYYLAGYSQDEVRAVGCDSPLVVTSRSGPADAYAGY